MKNRYLLYFLIISTAAIFMSCGGGGGGGGGDGDDDGDHVTLPPTITSIKDANGTELTSGESTGINPTSFTITFDQDMDSSTTNADNITLSCEYGGNNPINASLSIEGSGKTYTITVQEAWRYALMTCTQSFSSEVKSASGLSLSTGAAISFTNACAVSDDFNAESISDEDSSCWSVYSNPDLEGLLQSWAEMNGIISIDVSNSILNAELSGRQSAIFTKTASIDENGFEVEMHLKTIQTLYSCSNGTAGSYIMIINSTDVSELNVMLYMIGIANFNGVQKCFAIGTITGQNQGSNYAAVCGNNSEYLVKLVQSGGTVTLQYKENNGEYANLTKESSMDFPIYNFSDRENLIVMSALSVRCEPSFELDSVYVDGISVSGQY